MTGAGKRTYMPLTRLDTVSASKGGVGLTRPDFQVSVKQLGKLGAGGLLDVLEGFTDAH